MRKDPNSVEDFLFGWLERLDGDTITDHEILLAPAQGAGGLVIESSEHNDTTVTAWLSGGVIGTRVDVTCRVTTAGGRTWDKTSPITIANT